jgi:hypothetical protein
MNRLISCIILLCSSYTFAQTKPIEAGKHGNLVAYLYELQQIQGIDNIHHQDSILNYSINIPLWWKIRETPSPTLFGGTFPAVDGIENALMLKSFDKNKFKDASDFENWIIKKYKIGDIPEWSDSHTILLKKELNDFKNLGHAYSVQLMRGGKLYYCCYIIVETKDTYLWIDFTATQETYDINFGKFKELMTGLSIIKK